METLFLFSRRSRLIQFYDENASKNAMTMNGNETPKKLTFHKRYLDHIQYTAPSWGHLTHSHHKRHFDCVSCFHGVGLDGRFWTISISGSSSGPSKTDWKTNRK